MDDERTPDETNPDAPALEPPPDGPSEDDPDPASEEAPNAADPEAETDEPGEAPPPRSRRILRPWEALEKLDEQWEDRRPLPIRPTVHTLSLTVPEDPRGFDYLGALTGAADEETADAHMAWLDAQLASDAIAAGLSSRPIVALVPANRLWYAVRVVMGYVVVIDGPGFLSPREAALAARRRFRAELLAILAGPETDASDAPAPADAPIDPAPGSEGAA